MDHSQRRRLSTTGESLYAILGIPKTSTTEEIKRSYRKLALSNHPDKNPGDDAKAEKFKEISKSYAILSDNTKRTIYDNYGSLGLYISDQFGDENVKAYFMLTSPWAKIGFLVVAVITGCYCCCCCCCCCNFCCGKCRPAHPEDSPDYANLQQEDEPGVSPSSGGEPASPVTTQPAASAKPSEASPLRETSQPAYN